MKLFSFVFILLFSKADAGFFDDFRVAISNINQGFGKLFGDVVTDVKDTLYCTISAVEQVLVQNGLLDQRRLYNQKCQGTEKPKEQPATVLDPIHSTLSKTVSKIHKHSIIRHKHSSTRISHEETSIKNVNKTVIIDDSDNKNLKLTDEHLAEIGKIIKQESENISDNFKKEIKKFKDDNNQSHVESILEEIKSLNVLQRNSKNDTEVNKIRRIFDKITNSTLNKQEILDSKEFEILKKEIQKLSGNNEKLNSTEETRPINGTEESLQTETKENITNTTVEKPKTDVNASKQNSDSQTEPVKSEQSIFGLGMNALSSLFKSMSNPEVLQNAKNIVSESQHSEKVLADFFKG